MSLTHSMEISASGMDVERQRLEVAAYNMANANTTRTAAGSPFHRQVLMARAVDAEPMLASAGGLDGATIPPPSQSEAGFPGSTPLPGGVISDGVVDDPRPLRHEYSPGHPDAGPDGWVTLPNVDPVEEMVDVMQASQSYEANASAFSAARQMAQRALDLMR